MRCGHRFRSASLTLIHVGVTYLGTWHVLLEKKVKYLHGLVTTLYLIKKNLLSFVNLHNSVEVNVVLICSCFKYFFPIIRNTKNILTCMYFFFSAEHVTTFIFLYWLQRPETLSHCSKHLLSLHQSKIRTSFNIKHFCDSYKRSCDSYKLSRI